MRAVVTRVNSASVTIDGRMQANIGKGFLVLLGVHRDDTKEQAKKIADKIMYDEKTRFYQETGFERRGKQQ